MDKVNSILNNKISRIRVSSKMASFMANWHYIKLINILIREIFKKERNLDKVPFSKRLIKAKIIKISLGYNKVTKDPG